MNELLEVLDRVVDRACAGEGVEAFAVDSTETTVKARAGEVESLSSARTRGVGVRVIADARAGYAYTADLGDEALAEALAEARANAEVAGPDEANQLPLPATPDALELYDPAFAEVGPQDKVDAALHLDRVAREGDGQGPDPRVRGVDTAQYGDTVATVAIASTTGVRDSYRRCDAYGFVEVLAAEGAGTGPGASAAAFGVTLGRTLAELDLDAAAAEGRQRAVRLLGGRKPPSQRVPIIMDPFAAASLLGVLGGALSAEAVLKGRSLFADKVGERVGAPGLALIDDGRTPGGLATAPWDDEGTATRRTPLIVDGVLQGFLHNAYTASRSGGRSTGNASRASFRSSPGVSSTNLFFEPGSQSPEELIAAAGTGFYCQAVLGVHSGVNPVSGDFSVGASGLLIRDGGLAEPVREATIAGTVPAMLSGLVAVANDLRWLPFGGATGGATFLLEGMTLGGA